MLKTRNKCNAITRNDVNRQLCARIPVTRSEHELIGPYGKYRDENRTIYLQKCKEFEEKAKEVWEKNRRVMRGRDVQIGFDMHAATARIREGKEMVVESSKEYGTIQRCRTTRMCPTPHRIQSEDRRCRGAWVHRHLVLWRFVDAARTVVLKNRLLKNLNILRQLTPEKVAKLEAVGFRRETLLFEEVFRNFLYC